MIQRKIVLNIFEMGLPEDILELIIRGWFDDGVFVKIDSELLSEEDYWCDAEDLEAVKIFKKKLVDLGIDLDLEKYILLTYEPECEEDSEDE